MVREQGKVQEVHTPVITRKATSDKLPEGVGYKPTLDLVNPWPHTGTSSKSYPLAAQGPPLPGLTYECPPEYTEECSPPDTGTQGNSMPIRGTVVPPPVSRHSGTVSVLGAHHAVLRPHFTTMVLL